MLKNIDIITADRYNVSKEGEMYDYSKNYGTKENDKIQII